MCSLPLVHTPTTQIHPQHTHTHKHTHTHSSRLTVGSKPYYIIHDLEGSTEGKEDGQRYTLECQLEYALERKYPTIILENSVLGYEVVRWIRMGNFLHKTAVLSGFVSLAATFAFPHPANMYMGCSVGAVSLACAGVYAFSWQMDPCCKYQVDYSLSSLAKVPQKEFKSVSGKHFVLVCKDDKYRKRLHNAIAFAVVGVVGWKLYRHFASS